MVTAFIIGIMVWCIAFGIFDAVNGMWPFAIFMFALAVVNVWNLRRSLRG